MDDPFMLRRFVDAQDPLIDQVSLELAAGEKRTHWMWFVFPQIAGLGPSAMARRYAIASLAEAEAYLRHPILAQRLDRWTRLVLAVPHTSIGRIFGPPDDMKFHSSMTLFARVADAERPFQAALDRYFGGMPDPATIARL